MVLDEGIETSHGQVSNSNMHLPKGLEFRAMVVMDCGNKVIPLQARIETKAEESRRCSRTDSLARLSGDAHNIAKTTASGVHLNPPDRGMIFDFFHLAGVPRYD